MKNIELLSTNKRDTLHVGVWEPSENPKAILQISHGMIEYIERYDEFAEFLKEKGVLVIANDHLGHGKTASCDDDLGFFGEGKSKTVVDDLHEVTKYAKKTYGENLPYFLFGHSMGSFMARRYLMTYGEELTAAIICGTGYTPGVVLGAGRFVANCISLFKGERHRSTFLKNLAFGTYNKRIDNPKSPNAWLSVNEENVMKYDKDKYCTFSFTVNGYQGLFEAIAFIQKKKNIEKVPKDLPLLFIAGEDDPVGNYGEGVKKAHALHKNAGAMNTKVVLLPNNRHEILNEHDRYHSFEIIYDFIENLILAV